MTLKNFSLYAAPLTPLDSEGLLIEETIHAYAELLIRNNISGIFVNGTTGEGYRLSMDIRKSALEKWVSASQHQLAVLAHITCASIEESRELATHAKSLGVDAIGIMGPLFYKPENVEGLVDYVSKIASSVGELPCYYYHLPAMNSLDFQMIDFLKIAENRIPNLKGIKYTHENFFDIHLCKHYKDGHYQILHGRDETLLYSLMLGNQTAIGSTYNYMAPLYTQIIDAYVNHNLEKAEALQHKAVQFIQCIIKRNSLIESQKVIMDWLGIPMPISGIASNPLSKTESQKLLDDLFYLGFEEFACK